MDLTRVWRQIAWRHETNGLIRKIGWVADVKTATSVKDEP